MTSTTSLVELLLLLLIAASVVALITSRLRVPYTAALVFAGVGIGLVRGPITAALATMGMAPGQFDILTPEVVFTLFLPGLLFESSLHLNLRELRENVWPIVVLAAAGVIVATLTTGYAVSLWLGLPVASALVFGALISATDPISVVALFRELGVHRRLTLIVEGESLFNDGTAVVLFQILLASALGGKVGVGHGLVRFGIVVAGGLALGAAAGYAASLLTSYVDEPRIEITLTTIVAYGSYLAAEHLHVSGVIATVAAGLVVGNAGVVKGMSSWTRVALFGFWEYLAFVVNSLLFLLIGIAVHVSDLLGAVGSIALATAAVILGRLLTVYTLTPVSNRFSAPIPLAWRHVLFWGGLHGSVSVALALGLPVDLPGRALILNMTFGVVALSIVVQGGTMQPLVAWLKLRPRGEEAYDGLKAEQLAAAGARAELQVLRERHLITATVQHELGSEIDTRLREIENGIVASQQANPAVANEERRFARLRLALAERSALERAVGDGMVTERAARPALRRATDRIDAERKETQG
jgi:CPA1 family monovalent cation:H+ antiporter